MTSSDSELLRAYCEQGSEEAFAALVQRRFDLVYAVALRQVGGDAHLARDVVQRVFTDLARKARSLSPRVVISGWLYRSATFAASDLVRAERRRRAREQEACSMNDSTIDPVTEAEWERLRPLLDVAVSELRPRDRDAIMLRVFEHRTYSEIGDTLRVSEDAARMRVERAFEKLRVRLRHRGVTSTASALSLVLAGHVVAAPAGLATAVASTAISSAASSAAVGGLAGIATFMSTSKTTAAITAAAAAICIGTGIQQSVSLRDEVAGLEAVAVERDQLAAALRSREAGQAAAALRPKQSTQPVAGSTSTGNQQSSAAGTGAFLSDVEQIMQQTAIVRDLYANSPEFQKLQAEFMRSATRLDYTELFRELQLSPAEIERFEQIMLDLNWHSMDTHAAIAKLGLTADDPAAAALFREGRERRDSALRELLGTSGYERYLAHTEAEATRSFLQHVASTLYCTSAPLTNEQAGELTRILVEHNHSAGHPGDPWGMDGIDWESVHTLAQGVLSSNQLHAWRLLSARMRWSNEASDLAFDSIERSTP